MSSFWHEVRLGIRFLGKKPGFTAMAVLNLTLGIGATSSIVSVVQAVLLRPLPYRNPESLVLVTGTRQTQGLEDWPASYLDLLDWRQRNRVFEDFALGTDPRTFTLRDHQEPEVITGEMVSTSYFSLLGVEPEVGRTFLAHEDQTPGGDLLAVISHGLWQRRFGADSAIVDQTLQLDETIYTVVGVMPAGFHGLTDQAEIWLPISMATTIDRGHLERRDLRWLSALARLKPGVTVGKAQQDLDDVTEQLQREYPDSNRGIGGRVTPLSDALVGDLRPPLLTLLGATAFVLLIGCINVANLLLVRVTERQGELAIRVTLGAGKVRLMRQLFIETLLLTLLGGVFGLLLAQLCTGLLIAASGLELMSFIEVGTDPVVIGVTLVISILSGLLCNLGPSLVISNRNLHDLLTEGKRTATRGWGTHRFQEALTIGELTLALILLVGGGLMMLGFQRFTRTDLGFEPDHLLTMRILLKGPSYAADDSVRLLARQSIARLETLPGVRSVALVGPDLPTDDWFGGYYTLEDRIGSQNDDTVVLLYHFISPGYFATLGIPLLRGRDFTTSDDHTAPHVVIVSATLANRFWPGQDPIGKRLKYGPRDSPFEWDTVVGVVEDVRHNGLATSERPAPDLYFPMLRLLPRTPPVLNLLISTRVPPGGLARPLREEFRRIAPELAVYDILTMDERLREQIAGGRFLVLLIGLFAASALTLAAVGIYGVVSYSVVQHTRDIGIRMALGAQRREVIRAVVAQGARLASIGVLLGVLGSLALTRFIESRLYGLSALNPVIFVAMSLLLLAIALAASSLPAHRATKIDPVIAIRAE